MDNSQFESKFNETPEAPKSVPAKSSVLNLKSKKGLILIVLVTICLFGLIIFVNGYFQLNVPQFDNTGLNPVSTSVNDATEIPSLKLTSDNQLAQAFSLNIKSPFPQDYTTQAWIQVNDTQKTLVGKLDSTGKLTPVYILPRNSDKVTVYEDGSIAFVINPPTKVQAELYLKKDNNLPTLLDTLDQNQYFINYMYSPSEKLFYYAFYDDKSQYKIEAKDFAGKTYGIYSSSFLKPDQKIIYVDPSLGWIFLGNQKDCQYLYLKDKSLNPYPCANIPSNNSGKIYWSNQSASGTYSANTKGELYLSNTDKNDRKVIATGNLGEIYSNLTYYNGSLYFVINNLTSIDSVTWVQKQSKVASINLSTLVVTQITDKLPSGKIIKLVPVNGTLFAIVSDAVGFTRMQRLLPTPEVQTIVTSTSYPTSFPGSYGVTYSSTSSTIYWKDVDLGTSGNVLMLEPMDTF